MRYRLRDDIDVDFDNQRRIANRIIEEFMLVTNEIVEKGG